ncbi:MAG: hypothetical protein JWO47_756, partial [Candidatus Saccharibacteria bacterium]|nr:hypothetical protein [Candidatus Saccharibacteria bacterium]
MWEINKKIARFAGLDEAQGADEQRSETYMEYGERAAQSATQRFAKNSGRVPGSAREQATEASKSGIVEVLFSY